jgi:ATP-dependent Clp protease ATP-binding subunit ClpA
MLFDENGLNLEKFDEKMLKILGDGGSSVLTKAFALGSSRVNLRHWLYVLAEFPGSMISSKMISKKAKSPDDFVDSIESAFEKEGSSDLIGVTRLTIDNVTDQVIKMLDRAEEIAAKFGVEVNEAALTLAILDSADEELAELLDIWKTDKFVQFLKVSVKPREKFTSDILFDDKKRLRRDLFKKSGWGFCKKLHEDAASSGAKKVNAKIMLYTILSNEAGSLFRVLQLNGIEVKRDVHSLLSREIFKTGTKRNKEYQHTSETLIGIIKDIFVKSYEYALDRGDDGIHEADINRAFFERSTKTLMNVLPPNASQFLPVIQDFLESEEIEDTEEDDKPYAKLTPSEIQENINSRVRGQTDAVSKIMLWIKRFRFGLTRDDRPAAVLLFMGPTGSGKTQIAKELAKYVYGDEDALLFLEMGQFQSEHSMSGFVGAPPGYVGYGDGKLTNGLRDLPECVVLFDEIEKAHTQVFDALLRFSDEGKISDPAGPVRDGTKCIIIMTSNAGQSWLQDEYLNIAELERNTEKLEGALDEARSDENLADNLLEKAVGELRAKGFRPEFIGRVDERITFLPFDLKTCRQILDDIIKKETDKMYELKSIELMVNDEARDVLTQKALLKSLREGARGIPRVVNEFIINPLIDLVMTAEEEKRIIKHISVSRTGSDFISVQEL